MTSRRLLLAGIAALLLLGFGYALFRPVAGGEPRAVSLSITGPTGQAFTGTYTADGVTHVLHAIAPTGIELRVRELAYEFQRAGGDAEFRVTLAVEQRMRTSSVSHQGQSVRGGYRLTEHSESAW